MSAMPIPPLRPEVVLPFDEGLPELPKLFDKEWVWQTFCTQFGEPEEAPQHIQVLNFSYRPGTRALVSYAVEWQQGRYVVDDQFAVELNKDGSERLFHFPDDPYLPGLPLAASGVEAHELVAKYVGVSAQRLKVETVRYRPGSRAVLRHIVSWRQARMGKVTLFTRVMPPKRIERLLAAVELVKHSGFDMPKLTGHWADGGVAWLTQVPGDTVRTLIREGTPPEPQRILDGLELLWSASVEPGQTRSLNLLGGFQMSERLFSHLLKDEEAQQVLDVVTKTLSPFSEEWRPSGIAHNDFYDDQILLTPEGHLALVDFEEAGLGDPLLDVGNMLAHLRWMARFGNASERCIAYRQSMRSAALDRFEWDAEELDMREAYALFRLTSGPVRQLRRDWPERIKVGLGMVQETLAGVAPENL